MRTGLGLLPGFSAVLVTALLLLDVASDVAAEPDARARAQAAGVRPGALTVLPEDGRELYLRAIDLARKTIRIEICVLEDPQILQRIQAALGRGVTVRAIVDRNKYDSLAAERDNLAQYLTGAGGELHLSNPIFPRSFPKIILVDSNVMVYGSGCLDELTFLQYRDFAHVTTDQQALRDVQSVFENDWAYSAPAGQAPPPFNPTPRIANSEAVVVSPVNGAERLVRLYQDARRTLDVYTELLGNPTLESELVAAAGRGVRVRLIAPISVNGGTPDVQAQQRASLTALAAAGVDVHVSGPEESFALPYMHARAAVADGENGYLGSISLSPDGITFNREIGLILRDKAAVRRIQSQFDSDYALRTRPF